MTHINKSVQYLLIGCSVAALSGCGGGSDAVDEVLNNVPSLANNTGRFIDSGVEGISYSGSKGTVGTTQKGGLFKYQDDEEITFKIGGVTLGSAKGASLLSPVDLTDSDDARTNMVRFLMSLDADGNPENGISVTEETLSDAASWTGVDFSATQNQFTEQISNIAGLTLVSEDDAQAHLNASLQCAYSGGYVGRWSGTGNLSGTIGILVHPDGSVEMTGKVDATDSDAETVEFYGSGGNIDPISKSVHIVGSVLVGDGLNLIADVTFETPESLSGSYNVPGTTRGTMNLHKVGDSSSAEHRFTGFAYGGSSPVAVFSFDVNEANEINGVVYDIYSKKVFRTLTGTVSGGTASMHSPNGDLTTQGTIDLQHGSFNGTWHFGGDSGSVSGTGCALN